jgi:DNA-binding NarL/FixJ family response regulator
VGQHFGISIERARQLVIRAERRRGARLYRPKPVKPPKPITLLPPTRTPGSPEKTERNRAILAMLAMGKSHRQVAAAFGLTVSRVSTIKTLYEQRARRAKRVARARAREQQQEGACA